MRSLRLPILLLPLGRWLNARGWRREFGGLPAWIFANGSIPIRTYAEPYISYVDSYWKAQLLPLLKKHLYSAGGNVVMVSSSSPPLFSHSSSVCLPAGAV